MLATRSVAVLTRAVWASKMWVERKRSIQHTRVILFIKIVNVVDFHAVVVTQNKPFRVLELIPPLHWELLLDHVTVDKIANW